MTKTELNELNWKIYKKFCKIENSIKQKERNALLNKLKSELRPDLKENFDK